MTSALESLPPDEGEKAMEDAVAEVIKIIHQDKKSHATFWRDSDARERAVDECLKRGLGAPEILNVIARAYGKGAETIWNYEMLWLGYIIGHIMDKKKEGGRG